MFLVFDTETTGLPLSWRAPASDVDNWPRLVQLAWEAYDPRGRKTLARSYVIRPDGFTIPRDAERVHGISTSVARRKGVPLAEVLGAEYYRLGHRDPFRRKRHVCTMEAATEYCSLPGPYGYKWPRLSELYLTLFGKRDREAHDAAADVATCSRCFFELNRLGIVRVRGVAPHNALKRTRARARVNM